LCLSVECECECVAVKKARGSRSCRKKRGVCEYGLNSCKWDTLQHTATHCNNKLQHTPAWPQQSQVPPQSMPLSRHMCVCACVRACVCAHAPMRVWSRYMSSVYLPRRSLRVYMRAHTYARVCIRARVRSECNNLEANVVPGYNTTLQHKTAARHCNTAPQHERVQYPRGTGGGLAVGTLAVELECLLQCM